MAQRQIARAVHIGLGSVNAYLNRAAEVGLEWDDTCALDEAELKQRLYPSTPPVNERFVAPDFGNIHQELKSKGVTRQLLWEEYLQQYPDNALKYSQFCQRYREWVAGLKRSMRQIHKAGEKLFVDYAGPTIPIVNPHTGEFREAQGVGAVLGASKYSDAEATYFDYYQYISVYAPSEWSWVGEYDYYWNSWSTSNWWYGSWDMLYYLPYGYDAALIVFSDFTSRFEEIVWLYDQNL